MSRKDNKLGAAEAKDKEVVLMDKPVWSSGWLWWLIDL
jgi:hypothetical protein